MDLFYLQSVANELAPLLVGRRLVRAYQCGDKQLALDFNLRDGRWLIISTEQQSLSIHLTSRSLREISSGALPARNDAQFASLLRKYLRSVQLTAVEPLGYDRVVRVDFTAPDSEPTDELESVTVEGAPLHMYIQLTGRAADVILAQGINVVATLREREYSGGYFPPPPPPHLIDPFLVTNAQWLDLIASHHGEVSAGARQLIGFSDLYARELAALSERILPDAALLQFRNRLETPNVGGVIYTSLPLESVEREIGRADLQILLSPVRLEHLAGLYETDFDSSNVAADRFFTLQRQRIEFLARRQQAVTALQQSIRKLESLRQKLAVEKERFSSIESHQRRGELLLSNIHQAVKEGDAFLVADYYEADAPTILIPAAGKATAREAADHYFKLARKSRSGLLAIEARLPEIERDISGRRALLDDLNSIVDLAALEPFIQQNKLLRPGSTARANASGGHARQKEPEKISGVRRYRTSDGYEVLVGRTDRDNDHLTQRVAKSSDLWFHAADYPGSHVILRNPQRKPVPAGSVTQAAQLAAKFSQARKDTRVAVNYCEKKFVTKPKGFAPGQVRLSSFKTVIVEPRELEDRIL